MPHGFKAGGRKKGTPNRITGDIKAMVLTALDRAGGVRYLTDQAQKNPVAFLGLVARVMPTTIAPADGAQLGFILIPPKTPAPAINHDQRLDQGRILDAEAEPDHTPSDTADEP